MSDSMNEFESSLLGKTMTPSGEGLRRLRVAIDQVGRDERWEARFFVSTAVLLFVVLSALYTYRNGDFGRSRESADLNLGSVLEGHPWSGGDASLDQISPRAKIDSPAIELQTPDAPNVRLIWLMQ